ncbi:hypothetical protein [Nocardioides sp. GXQ0305]|uniref:hypothetical protein n=1 Tax=Nocardioides sp. GXQ0305 TaxID=3423912 RepID=UPI003D7D5DB1
MPQPRALAALLLSAGLLIPVLGAPVASTAADPGHREVARATGERRAASLDYAPKSFVGGQQLTFTGHIGATGRRVIRLQMHLDRPGDEWITIDGFRRRTQRDGSFRFDYVAPSMRDKKMRVRGAGGLVTPALTFNAKSQDLVLLEAGTREPLTTAVAGTPFDISVDTTPDDDVVEGRDDLPGPTFEGRALTLQQRVLDPTQPSGYRSPWITLSKGEVVTDPRGLGTFRDVPAPGATGAVVYRVRQENWTADGDRVGWFPSFPTCVDVLAQQGDYPGHCPRAVRTDPLTTPDSSDRSLLRGGGSTTAGVKYGWAPALWDFGWSAGESLSTPPHRGSDPEGWWLDWSEGTGRAVPHNGQLKLDSQRELKRFAASSGTTMVTMKGNPMRLGRWEVRLRAEADVQGQARSRTRIELVPADPADYACGARNLTLADLSPETDHVRFGVRAPGGTEWTRNVGGLDLDGQNHAWGVEVARDHITWFREGHPIGTLKSKAAIPDVPMTLRLSIVGEGDRLFNRTQTYYDWMRGYPLTRGREVRSGGGLQRGTFTDDC